MRLGLLLLIGLPCSGKTTLAKYLTKSFQNFSESSIRFIHVCYDELMPKKSYESEWKKERNSVSLKIEKLVLALKNKDVDLCPSEFKDQLECFKPWEGDFMLILDDNMYFRSMRYSLYQMAKKHRISFCQIFFNCSLENALLKNDFRTSDAIVPQHVIENMHMKIQPPNCKNNWEKCSLELEAFCNLDEVYCRILATLNHSLDNIHYVENDNETRELSKLQCKTSVLHQTDLALRKIVSLNIKEYFMENPKEQTKDYITELNLRKSEILFDVKCGNICLPDNVLSELNSDCSEKLELITFLNDYF